jgi:hypothetical protein
MPRAVFEPATPATKQPQTYALDRAATGIGESIDTIEKNKNLLNASKAGMEVKPMYVLMSRQKQDRGTAK